MEKWVKYWLLITGAFLTVIIIWLSFRHLEKMKEMEVKMLELQVTQSKPTKTWGVW